MRRNQWTAALFAILLFGLGAAVGALAHRYIASSTVAAHGAEDFRQHYIGEMRSKLKLTPTQVGQLETILDETKAKYKAVREQVHPAMLRIKEEQISRVKSILHPEQIPVYEQLVADHERQAREQEDHDRREDQHRAHEHEHGIPSAGR